MLCGAIYSKQIHRFSRMGLYRKSCNISHLLERKLRMLHTTQQPEEFQGLTCLKRGVVFVHVHVYFDELPAALQRILAVLRYAHG